MPKANDMNGIKLLAALCILFAISANLSAETIEIDLSKLEHGVLGLDIEGGPYYIIRRSAEEKSILIREYGEQHLRSGHSDFMLIQAVSPDSTCALLHVKKGTKKYSNHPVSLSGGFLDLCSCAWFDLTGRRKSENCSGPNITPAPHSFLQNEVVRVGVDGHN
ncbi:hypothetical protein [Gilvimarinus japonicus]|uniref:Uncharacterized protein n=2 Tax=Gilvimarinus japonicus TaxID=1796469 RepID=A0ABV7HTP3_9GAMM